jgi:hypothetical protein
MNNNDNDILARIRKAQAEAKAVKNKQNGQEAEGEVKPNPVATPNTSISQDEGLSREPNTLTTRYYKTIKLADGRFIKVPIKEDEANQSETSYTRGSKKIAQKRQFSEPTPPPQVPKGSIKDLRVPEHRREMFEKWMYLLGTGEPEEDLMYT